ncbi:hypothetical protein SAMN05216559_0723 [Halomicrobium zhouii]|uniref:Uncharacterized protein n=1 Tax=Halomicrobium zhouii TaxID=767519 RepID=A0A1I6KFI3_9EURY|nr:hypothetical protein [Halomicrobium zhouii]SFR89989.1 hypothetical protein SAMN05216559_0723 [Halomicrobium zhouii]
MPDPLRGALRERTTVGSVLGWATIAAIFWLMFDGALVQVALLVALLFSIDSIDVLGDVYGFSSAIKPLVVGIVGLSGIGAILFLESVAMFDEPGGIWQFLFLAALTVAGCWILYDGVRRLRREGVWADAAG